jgi:ribosomal-protein-alanine N-acetyltransferase
MLKRNFRPFPILTTERLRLRRLAITDEHEILALRTNPEINKYLNRPLSHTLEDARNFINKVNENIDKNDSLYWAITLNNLDILIGTICLFGFTDEYTACEIGYELSTSYQGQGIMKEAVEKVIDYAIHTLKVQKIVACLHRDNQPSIKLLEKLTFREVKDGDELNSELIKYCLRNLDERIFISEA